MRRSWFACTLVLAVSFGFSSAAHAKWPTWLGGKKQKEEKQTAATPVTTPVVSRQTSTTTQLRSTPPTTTVVREQAPPKPVITRTQVNQTVSSARSARWTTGFTAAHEQAVTEIKALYDAGEISAARDAAVQALHSYMDHHNLDIGHFPASQEFFARTYAAQAGLRGVLGW